jgi:S1 RNA binding domain protein
LTVRRGRWDSAPTLSEQTSQEPGAVSSGTEAPSEGGQAQPDPAPAETTSAAPDTSAPPATADSSGGAGEATDEGTEEAGHAGEPSPAGDGPPASMEVDIGNVVEGTVQRITPYGAFVQLAGGKVGLIHISEIDRNYVKDVHEFLRESDVVKAKVLTIKEDGKIDLSIKAMQDPQPRLQRRRGSDPEFEQKLKRFMRQSEERQVDYKRSVEHKRK